MGYTAHILAPPVLHAGPARLVLHTLHALSCTNCRPCSAHTARPLLNALHVLCYMHCTPCAANTARRAYYTHFASGTAHALHALQARYCTRFTHCTPGTAHTARTARMTPIVMLLQPTERTVRSETSIWRRIGSETSSVLFVYRCKIVM